MNGKQGLTILFFGTPEFGATILERLITSRYKPILAVTAPDMPAGRKQMLTPPPVKVVAEKHNIPVAQPKDLKKFNLFKTATEEVKLLQAQIDLIITAAYGKIIPKEILEIPKHGALNVHPSLLPRWRGPSPIQYAILAGDKKTGVSIMLMDEELDHGAILARQEFLLAGSAPASKKTAARQFTAGELSKKLAETGADLLIETIPKWIVGKIESQEQDHKKATYSEILTKEDGHIDWNKSAKELERQIRAFTPWPGSFTFWKKKRLKILAVRIVKNPNPAHNIQKKVYPAPGGGFCVATKSGVLSIQKLQPEGRGEMTSRQFLNGHQDILGALLE